MVVTLNGKVLGSYSNIPSYTGNNTSSGGVAQDRLRYGSSIGVVPGTSTPTSSVTNALQIFNRDPVTGKEVSAGWRGVGGRLFPSERLAVQSFGGVFGGSDLPSIAPPSNEAIAEYYASQKTDVSQGKNIDERILAQELSKPGATQSVQQGFMQPGQVQGANISLAMQGLSKPESKRSYEEQVAIIQASQGSSTYQSEVQRQVELKQKYFQPQLQKTMTPEEYQAYTTTGLTGVQYATDRKKYEYKSINYDTKKSTGSAPQLGYTQGRLIAESLASVPGQVIEGARETLITNPMEFGKSVGKEAKVRGDYTQIPKIIGEKTAGGLVTAGAFIVTQPNKFIGGTLESIFLKPAKFATQFGLTSLAIGGAGTLIGKGIGKITTIGKKYIPESEFVVPEVTSGLKNFPTTKTATSALKEFNKTKYATATGQKVVYSASDYPFTPFLGRKITVTSGRGLVKGVDVPGLYASTKGVSTYFLRLKQGLSQYKIFPSGFKDLLPSSPKILAIAQTPSRIPSVFRTSLAKAQSYFGKTPETIKLATSGAKNVDKVVAQLTKGVSGKPYISPALEFGLKNEAEAVIQVGSKLKRVGLKTPFEKLTGFSKYTKINGEVVPIYEMEVVGKGLVKEASSRVSAVSYGSYSSGVASKVLVSPKNIVSGLSSSYKSSVSSVVKSYVPKVQSYVPSKIVSKVSSSNISKSYIPSKSSSKIVSKTSSSSRVSSSNYVPEIPSYTPPTYTPTNYSSSKSTSYKLTPSYSVPKKYTSYTPPIIPPPKIPIYDSKKQFKEFNIKKKKFKLKKAFSVVSRVGGKERVLAVGVPKNIALAIGKSFSGGTTARSFKIKEIGLTQKGDIGNVDLTQYRSPKFGGRVGREGFTFVEKSKFAIDTPGEVRGLKFGRLKKIVF